MSVADARALVEKDFAIYDHIGEVADLPEWEAGILANKDPGRLRTIHRKQPSPKTGPISTRRGGCFRMGLSNFS